MRVVLLAAVITLTHSRQHKTVYTQSGGDLFTQKCNPPHQGCCSVNTPCDAVDQGDCDDDRDCAEGLKCGKDNCSNDPYGKHDCCIPDIHPPPSAPTLRVPISPPHYGGPRTDKCLAREEDWDCCKYHDKCGLGEGDCDTDNDCKEGLRCGHNNCRQHYSRSHMSKVVDCCEPKHTTIVSGSIDGKWLKWSRWSSCDKTCGKDSVRTRTRECSRPRNGGKICDGRDRDTKKCYKYPCPEAVDGKWMKWSPWSSCSKTCGYGGSKTRKRKCIPPKNGGENCCGSPQETKKCSSKPSCYRPVDGGWRRWSEWSECSESCGKGTKIRTRTCTNPMPRFGGRRCSGDTHERRACSKKQCRADGHWSEWSPKVCRYCSKTCGYGTCTQTRECNNPRPQNGGKDCKGDDRQPLRCHRQDCPTEPDTVPAVDGSWGEWSRATQCSVTCGVGHSIYHRMCDDPEPAYGGKDCDGEEMKVKKCRASKSCIARVDGGWGEWYKWERCDKTCGGGEKSRRRVCDNPPPSRGGLKCPGVGVMTVKCNDIKCPDYGRWTRWTSWSGCSTTCGHGQRVRHRDCEGNNHCAGDDEEHKECVNDRLCEVVTRRPYDSYEPESEPEPYSYERPTHEISLYTIHRLGRNRGLNAPMWRVRQGGREVSLITRGYGSIYITNQRYTNVKWTGTQLIHPRHTNYCGIVFGYVDIHNFYVFMENGYLYQVRSSTGLGSAALQEALKSYESVEGQTEVLFKPSREFGAMTMSEVAYRWEFIMLGEKGYSKITIWIGNKKVCEKEVRRVEMTSCSLGFITTGQVIVTWSHVEIAVIDPVQYIKYVSLRGETAPITGISPCAILYDHSNFRDLSEAIMANEEIAQLQKTKDKVSSIKLHRGCTLTFYDEIHFRGPHDSISNNVKSMSSIQMPYGTWDNQIASVKCQCGFGGSDSGGGSGSYGRGSHSEGSMSESHGGGSTRGSSMSGSHGGGSTRRSSMSGGHGGGGFGGGRMRADTHSETISDHYSASDVNSDSNSGGDDTHSETISDHYRASDVNSDSVDHSGGFYRVSETETMAPKWSKEDYRRMFDHYDMEGDGYIIISKALRALEALKSSQIPNNIRDIIERDIVLFDKNGDGKISFKEWVVGWESRPGSEFSSVKEWLEKRAEDSDSGGSSESARHGGSGYGHVSDGSHERGSRYFSGGDSDSNGGSNWDQDTRSEHMSYTSVTMDSDSSQAFSDPSDDFGG